jgi:poly(3-hydroxybutyrate) depolymerase
MLLRLGCTIIYNTMTKPLTTADVPPRFLRAAFLVGNVPRAALASDPRVSYAMYIPPEHYNPDPSASTAGVTTSTLPKLPLLVVVHGTGRDVATAYTDLIPFADETPCAILSPLFPAGLDGPYDLDSYKLLRSRTLRSDLALLSMLDNIEIRWPGIDTRKIYLMGFSGGGQFAHRFLYLYPERLLAVSVGAPGSVTLLDRDKEWPAGIADVEGVFGRTVSPELIGNVNIQLVVGGADNVVHGGDEFWVWLEKMRNSRTRDAASHDKMAQDDIQKRPIMKKGRLQTMMELHSLWEKESILAQLDVVEGVAHNSRGVRECVLQFMRSRILKHTSYINEA